MQLEESDNSKDVPPLRRRGNFQLSTYVEKNKTHLSMIGLEKAAQAAGMHSSLDSACVAQEVLD